MGKAMKWYSASIGNARGELVTLKRTILFRQKNGPEELSQEELDSGILIFGNRGKMADSSDSFLFIYTAIDPRTENISIAARFTDLSPEGAASWQSAFGIYAIDTARSQDSRRIYRNSIGCGRHRASRTRTFEYGVRAAVGATDPEALTFPENRIVDTSRVFISNADDLRSIELGFAKDDTGFACSAIIGGVSQEISIDGCDFLAVQDPEAIYVGFAVSGSLTVAIDHIKVEKGPGAMSYGPKDQFEDTRPGYPFDKSELPPIKGATREIPATCYVSPKGNPSAKGSKSDPLDLSTALENANTGTREIVLEDGIYLPESSLIASGQLNVTVRAAHPHKAIIDGSNMARALPVFIAAGEGWTLDGIVFRNSPNVGLLVSGSGNTICGCEAYNNKDTGILICSIPVSDRDCWPTRNLVELCESHHNCDEAACNADGFGAKLSVGEGNRFWRCIAYSNIDDGFDLYSKRINGMIGAVELLECIAFSNGNPSKPGNGVGFKLGGENMAVPHSAIRCVAFDNTASGFSSNSNPCCILKGCLALCNGSAHEFRDFHLYSDLDQAWTLEDCQATEDLPLDAVIQWRDAASSGTLWESSIR